MLKKSDSPISPLAPGNSLEVFRDRELLFSSRGKWLYPLFELEDRIISEGLDSSSLFLHDHIAGRAAASLIIRLGIRRCCIDTISQPGLDLFQRAGVECRYTDLVDKISCKTEEILDDSMSLQEVYRLLKRRAKLVKGISLDLEDLSLSFSAKPVLDHLSLSLEAGEQLVLTGDNGAGKTSLLKVILGTERISGGSIRIDGRPAGRNPAAGRRIAYIVQNTARAPFPLSCQEVVAMGLCGRRLSAKEQRYQVELAMRRTASFHLYGRDFYSLSGGERQRISLARCLCQQAGLILMDEPTSFLDAESKQDLLELLNGVMQHQMPTVLLVSHDHEWIDRLGWPIRELKGGRIS